MVCLFSLGLEQIFLTIAKKRSIFEGSVINLTCI